MRQILPLMLLVALLSGFRAFPSLSEQDPTAVFSDFQSRLNSADSLDDIASLLSARKRREYQRKVDQPGLGDRVVESLRQNFYLMHPQLTAQELHPDSAILIYKGAVNLNGQDYVDVIMGVLLVKEDGSWKVDRDKITYHTTVERDGVAHSEAGRLAF